MNKDQIKHWADVLKEIATGQLVFFCGKNLFFFTLNQGIDWLLLLLSLVIYLALHATIHCILAELENENE